MGRFNIPPHEHTKQGDGGIIEFPRESMLRGDVITEVPPGPPSVFVTDVQNNSGDAEVVGIPNFVGTRCATGADSSDIAEASYYVGTDLATGSPSYDRELLWTVTAQLSHQTGPDGAAWVTFGRPDAGERGFGWRLDHQDLQAVVHDGSDLSTKTLLSVGSTEGVLFYGGVHHEPNSSRTRLSLSRKSDIDGERYEHTFTSGIPTADWWGYRYLRLVAESDGDDTHADYFGGCKVWRSSRGGSL